MEGNGVSQSGDPSLGSSQLHEVDVVLSRLKRRAKIYQWLGFNVYILGSVGLVRFVPSPQVAMVFQMLLFQCILIYIFTHPEGIFTAMRGAFEVGLIANRQMIPAMEKFSDVLGKLEPHVKDSGDLKRMALDFKEEAGKLRIEVGRLADSMGRPVVPSVPRPAR
jgi:hypothetical protein